MAKTVKLGRIWTVPIQGTYSLALLIVLVATMTGWQMRAIVGGYGLEMYAVAGIGSAILFVWTVFAHETAHVAAARHFGARVKGVTLSLVGGEAAISGQPGSPWQSVAVAVSGPAVSALCGGALIGAAFGVVALSGSVLIAMSVAWVGFLCLLLAIANLIPAAPLDGGHVLHAIVWAKTGSRTRASAVAGFAGQVVGAATLVWAAWLLIQDGAPLAAAATAMVGWPLWRGASATRRVAQQRELLAGLSVSAAMQRYAIALKAEDTLAAALAELPHADADHVAIVDAVGKPIALVPASQLLRSANRDPSRQLGEVTRRARRRLITATVDEPLADLLERSYGRPRAAAVVVGGRFAGIVDPKTIEAKLATPAPARASRTVSADTWPGHRAHRFR